MLLMESLKMAKDYVLVLVVSGGAGELETALLILKDRPHWQKGRLNLPGGKVEEGESPEDAAIRELKEETGIVAYRVAKKGIIKDHNFTIHCFEANAIVGLDLKPREGETEQPLWLKLVDAYKDPRLMPNLRVIIPLMRSRQDGWVVEDNTDLEKQTSFFHTITVSVPA